MKEVLQVAYLRHLQDFYLFESVKDGIVSKFLSCVHTAILAWNCGAAWKCLVNVPRGSAVRKRRSEVTRESDAVK